uniref:Putative transposase n=1 Tax=viral metagenome TaxID=1070528 RepID=A0A6M3K5R2_9ZZZZ
MLKKYTYEYVKDAIEREEYKLLSTKYINSSIKLNVLCPKNHKYKVKYNVFQQGKRCPVCAGTQRHTYKYIKEQIEFDGYKLLSTSYKNANTKLQLQCSKGHEYEAKYSVWYVGKRCPYCYGNVKHTYEYIKSEIEKECYVLSSKSYNGNKSNIGIVCSEGHEYTTSWNVWQRGFRCPICNGLTLTSKAEDEIYQIISSVNDIVRNDRTQIVNPKTGWNLELDIWMPSLKKAIEFNGIHWHKSEYSKYKDRQKILQCEQKKIDLLIIQERDWLDNKSLCINTIEEFIND